MALGHRLTGLTAENDEAHPDGITLVHVARGMTFDAGRVLVLVDLAPSTIYLSLHDSGEVGYLATGWFLDAWERSNVLAQGRGVPAVLSLLDTAAQVTGDARLRVRRPRIQGSGLAYEVAQIVDGVVPEASGSCVLVVQPGADTTTLDTMPEQRPARKATPAERQEDAT